MDSYNPIFNLVDTVFSTRKRKAELHKKLNEVLGNVMSRDEVLAITGLLMMKNSQTSNNMHLQQDEHGLEFPQDSARPMTRSRMKK